MRPASYIVRCLSIASVLIGACQPLDQASLGPNDGGGMDGGVELRSTAQALETSLCGPTSGLQAGSPWPMRGGCPTHAARSSEYGSLTGAKNWSFDTFGDVRSSAAVDSAGYLYIGSDNGKLYKLNPTTGAIVKDVYLWGAIKSTPAIATDGTVYVTGDFKKLHAVNPTTFALKWSYTAGGAISSSPAIQSDGVVVFGSADKSIYAINPTGTKKWSYLTGGAISSSPAIAADGVIYVGSSDTNLYALTATGTLKWKTKLPAAVDSSPAVGRFGRVYVSSADKVYGLDAVTGAIVWQKSLGSCTVYSPAISESGVVLVGTSFSLLTGGSLYALTPDGNVLWQYDTLGGVESTPTIDRAGNIFFGSNDGSLYAVNAAGKQIWKHTLPNGPLGGIKSSPTIAKGGAIIFGSDDNWIYSVGVGVPLTPSGATCSADAECEPGLICGNDNGARFGKPAGSKVCWLPSCENKVKDPAETEVDCGGPCGSCASVCSQACTAGSQVTPPALEVLSFSKGAFIRGSDATYQTGASKIAVARGDQLRYEDRGDGNGRVALFEGARANRIVWSESMGHLPEWWKGVPQTPTMTLTEDASTSPNGAQSADRWQASAGGNAARAQTIINAMPAGSLSAWLRLTNPASFNPASPLKTRAVLTDLTGGWYNEALDWSLPAAWERRSMVTTSATQSTAVQMSHKGAWPGGAAQFPALPAADFLVWGWQLEEGKFPSSYIPTQESSVTRKVDQVVFETTAVPTWLRTGKWQIDVLPLYSSAEIATTDEFVLMAWEGGQLSLAKDATGGLVKLVSGTTTAKRTIGWARNTKLTLTIDGTAKTLQVLGATTGDGAQSYGSISIAVGRVGIGALFDGTKPAFARISEPRKVSSPTVACVTDTDCIKCGDGVVNGSEVCDPGANPRCNKDCTARDFPTQCFGADSVCPPGTVCPLVPNGMAFDGYATERFCVPQSCLSGTRNCGDTDAAICGHCPRTPSCSAKRCGDDPDDGAGGFCSEFCAPKEPGCQSDNDCTDGYVCGKSAADRFNPTAPSTANACWPAICEDSDPRRIDCGTKDSPCGVCDPATFTTCFQGELCNKGKITCGGGEVGNEVGACIPLQGPGLVLTDDVEARSVGALPGAFDVTSAGAAAYNIPITVPPGRGDLQPALSIAYNSTQGNGVLGLGWGVNGLSAISLCNKSPASDPSPPSATPAAPSPALCLDGQRLIPVAYDAVAKRTEWRTEVENFARIYSSPGDLFNQIGDTNTPETFLVRHKSGIEMTYGVEANARLLGDTFYYRDAALTQRWKLGVRMWAVSRAVDRAGNRITYLYSKARKEVLKGESEDVEIVPRWIGYNFKVKSDERSAGAEIKFDYLKEGEQVTPACRATPEAKGCEGFLADSAYGFWRGSPVTHSYRLEAISVYAVGTRLRRYQVSYKVAANKLAELSTITECAYDAQGRKVCRPDTSFEYQPVTFEMNEWLPAPKFTPSTLNAASINWNKDGFDDLLFVDQAPDRNGRPATTMRVHLGSPSGIASNPAAVIPFPDRAREDEPAPYISDMDGDGADDIVIEIDEDAPKLLVVRGGTTTASQLLESEYAWPGDEKDKVRFLDLDGDGDSDALFCNARMESHDTVTFFENVGGAFRGATGWARPSTISTSKGYGYDGYCGNTVVDSGDGREMLVSAHNSSSESKEKIGMLSLDGWGLRFTKSSFNIFAVNGWQYLSALDVNGDGLRDLVTLPLPAVGGDCIDLDTNEECDNYPRVRMNADDGLGGFGPYRRHFVDKALAVISDIDQDGRPDWAWREAGFLRYQDNGSKVERIPLADNGKITVLDANGDGRTDFYQSGIDRVYLGASPQANMLKKVIRRETATGVPDEILVTYATGVASGTYTPGVSGSGCDVGFSESFPRCIKRLGAPVVRSVTRRSYRQESGTPEIIQSSGEEYSYEDGRMDQRGRGWIGFRKRTIVSTGVGGVDYSVREEEYDLTPYARSTQDFWYFYPYASEPRKVTVRTPLSSHKFLKTDGLYRVEESTKDREVRLSWRGVPFVVTTASDYTLTDFDVAVNKVHRDLTYDTYGNVKLITTTFPMEPERREASYRTYAYESAPVRIGRWQVDLVEQHQTLSLLPLSGDAGAQTSNVVYNYNTAGLLTEMITAAPFPRDTRPENRALITEFIRPGEWSNVEIVKQRAVDPKYQQPERVWSFDYDKYGVHVKETQNPEGHVESTHFSLADGLLRAYSDANRVNTRWKYDGFGRLVEEDRRTESIVTTVQYYSPDFFATALPAKNAALWVGSVTRGASGSTVTRNVAFDSGGRVVAEVSPGFAPGTHVLQENEYDLYGRLARSTRPHLLTDTTQGSYTFAYDTLGRIIRTKTADARETNVYYATIGSISQAALAFYNAGSRPDARGFRFVESPKKNSLDVQIMDARGQTIVADDSGTGAVQFAYGAGGFLLSTTDAAGNVTSRVPDSYGTLKQLVDPSTGTHSFKYNPWGEVLDYVHNTEQVTYRYDNLGRVVSLQNSDGLSEWIWDQVGLGWRAGITTRQGELLQIRSPGGHIEEFNYDVTGSLDAIYRHVESGSGQNFESYLAYDDMRRLKRVDYGGGAGLSVEYRYGASSGFLESVVDANDVAKVFWKVEKAHQGYLPNQFRFGDGTTENQVLDPLSGRLVEAKTVAAGVTNPLQRTILHQDLNGNVDSVTRQGASGATEQTTYYYDQADRLKTVRKGGSTGPVLSSYSYSPAIGQLASKSDMGTYSYGLPSETNEFGPKTMPYAVRKITSPGGTHEYSYDAFGRMIERKGPSVSGGTQKLSYNAMGQLRLMQEASGKTTTFAYSAAGDRVLMRDALGASKAYFGPMYEVSTSASGVVSETYRVLAGGQAVAEITNAPGAPPTTAYLHRDHLGSVELVTSKVGSNPIQVLDRRNYGPYGEPGASQASGSRTNVGYTGHREEQSAGGLVDMIGRFYDPAMGRFISPDPFVPHPLSAKGYDRYAYVINNPLSRVDPNGFWDDLPPVGGGGGDDTGFCTSTPLATGCGRSGSIGNLDGGALYYRNGSSSGGESGWDDPDPMRRGGVCEGLSWSDCGDKRNAYYAEQREDERRAAEDYEKTHRGRPGSVDRRGQPTSGNATTGPASRRSAPSGPGASTPLKGSDGVGASGGGRGTEPSALDDLDLSGLARSDSQNVFDNTDAVAAIRCPAGGCPSLDVSPSPMTAVEAGAVTLFRRFLGWAFGSSARGGAAASNVFLRTGSQLASKFKHAKDFGVVGNYSKANAGQFSRAIHQHINSPAVRAIEGTYHKSPVTHYLDPSSGLNVMADSAGNFISGWKLSPAQLQNVLTHGGL